MHKNWPFGGIDPALEWTWGATRPAMALILIAAGPFTLTNEAFRALLPALIFILCYSLGLAVLLVQKRELWAFLLGFLLDTFAVLFAWLSYLLVVETSQTSDMYLAIVPIVIMGVMRLGWLYGSLYGLVWLAWLAGSTLYFYSAGSNQVQQLPVRLLFLAVIIGLVARLVVLIDRERRLERLRLQQAQQFSRYKSDLIRSISHQIRTPLTGVVASAEVLANEEVQLEPEQRRRVNELLLRAANELGRIIEDSLAYGQAQDDGHANLMLEPVSTEDLINEAVEQMTPFALSKEQQIVVQAEPGLPQLWVARNLIGRVILSLLENACEYTPPGGQISIRATSTHGSITIEVADDGEGIPADDMPFVFDEYYRGSKADQHAVKGTGLGLSLAKRLVEMHGGTITIRKVQERGTAVAFSIPVQPA